MQSKYTTRVTKNVVKLCRDLLLSAVVLGETNLVSCRHTLDPARQWTAAVGTGDGVPSWVDHHLLMLILLSLSLSLLTLMLLVVSSLHNLTLAERSA